MTFLRFDVERAGVGVLIEDVLAASMMMQRAAAVDVLDATAVEEDRVKDRQRNARRFVGFSRNPDGRKIKR